MEPKLKTVYCKKCRNECLEVDCASCANRYKGICDRCLNWRGMQDYYELSPYYQLDKSE